MHVALVKKVLRQLENEKRPNSRCSVKISKPTHIGEEEKRIIVAGFADGIYTSRSSPAMRGSCSMTFFLCDQWEEEGGER